MNADQLLAHYERIADTPNAIMRLRRFILDLAVRGKLVEQNPNDEPVSELLKRIAAEKARLVKAGEIKKSKSKQVDRFNTLFELPKSWKWATLCDLFLYDAGVKRQPKNLNQKLWLLELEDIEKDSGRLLVRITASERESKSTKSEFRVGDILYGKLRPYLNKVLVADHPGYSTTEIVALRPLLRLCPQYCALALRRPDFVDYVTRLGQGTKMPRLRTEDAAVAPFPLPPLAEQHRIVDKVDELMVLCDRLEEARTEREATRDRLAAASLARLNAPDPDLGVFQNHAAFALDNLIPLTTRPDQIKALRQTILNLAVRGKLVEQDPNDEPASELLKRIAVEKALRAKTGKVRVRASILSGRPFESDSPIPAAWTSVRLAELSNIVMGQSPPSETYNTYGEGVPLINGPVEFSDGPFGMTVANQHTTAPTNSCDKGDFLICVRGSTTGRSNIAAFDACIGRGVAAIQPLFGDGFVRLFLWSMRERIISMGRGIAFPSITRKQLENLLVPLPPLAEQHRIVAKVDELMALCDQLEASLDTSDDTRCRLLDALLHEALAASEKEIRQDISTIAQIVPDKPPGPPKVLTESTPIRA